MSTAAQRAALSASQNNYNTAKKNTNESQKAYNTAYNNYNNAVRQGYKEDSLCRQ